MTASWYEQAERQGYERPDEPCPYKKGSPSYNRWQNGRQRRLLGDYRKAYPDTAGMWADIDTELAQRRLDAQP